MAALTYSINFVDGGDSGSGPYTLTLFKNPTTLASGGTAITLAQSNPAGLNVYNIIELGSLAIKQIVDNIAIAVATDTNN